MCPSQSGLQITPKTVVNVKVYLKASAKCFHVNCMRNKYIFKLHNIKR